MSKFILFDFQCKSCERTHEAMTKPGEYWSRCPHCGGNAQRILSSVRIDHSRMALSASASPGSIAHFDRLHQMQRAKEERSFARNGDYGKAAGSD